MQAGFSGTLSGPSARQPSQPTIPVFRYNTLMRDARGEHAQPRTGRVDQRMVRGHLLARHNQRARRPTGPSSNWPVIQLARHPTGPLSPSALLCGGSLTVRRTVRRRLVSVRALVSPVASHHNEVSALLSENRCGVAGQSLGAAPELEKPGCGSALPQPLGASQDPISRTHFSHPLIPNG